MHRGIRTLFRLYRTGLAWKCNRGVTSGHNRLAILYTEKEGLQRLLSIRRFHARLLALLNGFWFTANSW